MIKNTIKNSEKEISLDGLFVAIGHEPATELFLEKLKIDEDGYILTNADSTKTSIEEFLLLVMLQIKFIDKQLPLQGWDA